LKQRKNFLLIIFFKKKLRQKKISLYGGFKKSQFFWGVQGRPTHTVHWAPSSHLYSGCDVATGTSIEGRAVLGRLGASWSGGNRDNYPLF